MKKQYDDLSKEKDRNDYEIKQLKEKERQLEDKLRHVHEELEKSDGTEIRNQLKEHVENRKKHLDEIRDVLAHLNDHITRLNLNEEFVPNESAWHYYSKRVEELEDEIKTKENRINNETNENNNLRMEVETNKKNKSD